MNINGQKSVSNENDMEKLKPIYASLFCKSYRVQIN